MPLTIKTTSCIPGHENLKILCSYKNTGGAIHTGIIWHSVQDVFSKGKKSKKARCRNRNSVS